MLPQTEHEFSPALRILVFELDAGRSARHPLRHRDHPVLDEDARENGGFPQPGITLGGMGAGGDTGYNNCAGFLGIAQPELQSSISSHAHAHEMGALDVEATHHSGDVVYRE